jgi:ribosomal protein L29
MNSKININKTFKDLNLKELEIRIFKNRKDLFSLKIKKSLNQKFKPHEFKSLKYEYHSLLLSEYKYYLNKLLSN